MVDTGAAPNLIKINRLISKEPIDNKQVLFLTGITDGQIRTLGSVEVSILGRTITFHVVPSDFPISRDGILGSEFLCDVGRINFVNQTVEWREATFPFVQRESIRIPARSSIVLYVKVSNTYLKTGYVPRLKLTDGIYLGEAVVTNRNGRAFLRAFNTKPEDCMMPVPTIELQEFNSPSEIAIAPTEGVLGPCNSRKTGYASEDRRVLAITESTVSRAEETKPLLRLEHLNREEATHVENLINKHNDIFHLPGDKLGYTSAMRHKIRTTDDNPIHTKQYRFPTIHKGEIDKQVKSLLENDVIKPSVSPYNSPLWIVPKKADSKGNKKWRMVIDYRTLNEKTIGDAYPLPNITDILDQLGSAKYFSVFDLASGFHQIRMDDNDAPKTAFSTPYGHYEFNRMPFGLKNAPATFQRLMDLVLAGLQGIELFVYLDDIVLYASSLREHKIKFEKLAARLRQANLRLQPDKCEFLRREVTYLGHIISESGVKPDPQKIQAVKEFPQPTNAKGIKQFLGLAGYYRRFIPDFSKTAKPLTNLLKKETVFLWGDDQDKAFVALRDALCSQPLLQYPDFTKPFIVTTDASNAAIGGILSQGTIGRDLPISYASRLLNEAERNYSTIEKELLAIVYCVNYFRPYLYGRKFQLTTDHKPLVWLHSVKDPTSRLVRWRLKLAEYDYEVIYKAGKINVNADALSRNPIPEKIFPLSSNDSDNSIFSPSGKEPNPTINKQKPKITSTNIPEGPSVSPHSPSHQKQGPEAINSDFSNDSDDDDNESSETDETDEPLVDPADEPYEFNRARIVETRDNLGTRNDHIVAFVTERGEPYDEGSRILRKQNRLPDIKNAVVGRAKVIKQKKKYIVLLVAQDRVSAATQLDTLKELIASLYDVTRELGLPSVSISCGSVGDVSWPTVRKLLTRGFAGSAVLITMCSNQIIIPPEADRTDIIKENHATAIGGHKGVTKTYNRVRYRHFWPRMKEDVQTYVRECRDCQLKKLVRQKTRQPMILTDTPGTAFEKISMDIMGPLPMTTKDNSYILTIQDLLTKYSLAIPLRQTTAVNVADAFVNEFICIYGSPKIILTDQGTHFVNSLMKNIASKFKIKQCHTTAYRPQSNGSIERSHHVLWEYLKQFVHGNDWDEYLKLASFSYNTSVHEGTRYTPYELVFGKIAETPASDPPLNPEDNGTYTRYLTSLFNKLRDTQDIARENLNQAKTRSKEYYDRRIRAYNFKVDDLAYLLKEPLKNKLDNQYIGPYKIIEILGNNNVMLDVGHGRMRTVHTDKLKIAHERSSAAISTTPISDEENICPPSEEADTSSTRTTGQQTCSDS